MDLLTLRTSSNTSFTGDLELLDTGYLRAAVGHELIPDDARVEAPSSSRAEAALREFESE